MQTTARKIRQMLIDGGAGIVGFADLGVIAPANRRNMPRAVSFGIALPPAIAAEIAAGPTLEYYGEYCRLNQLLTELSEAAAAELRAMGFAAVGCPATDVAAARGNCQTLLPHKTVATLAGLGWIGKCALLVTEPFGSAVRINTVLTDAPLAAGTPTGESRCGPCTACVDACPGEAPSGKDWQAGLHRDSFFDALACRRAAREQAAARTGIAETFCGICISVCPWTRRYVARHGE
jgi:epoxyqueuosine reductase QueG